MALISEELTRSLTPTVIGELAKVAGLHTRAATRGMVVVGPVVILALADKAAGPEGPAAVCDLLPTGDSPPRLGELAFLARNNRAPASPVLAAGLGPGASAIGDTLDRGLGFRASALVPVTIPIVLGVIGGVRRARDLDASGIAGLLALEASEFRTVSGADARLVRESLDAGRRAADVKARFSREQWRTVRLGPVAATHLVMSADRSGPVGALREITAAARAVDEARRAAPATSVVTLAFEHDFTVDELTRFNGSRARADALEAVRDALDTIAKMSPADAPRFRRLVEDVAARVAAVADDAVFRVGTGPVSKPRRDVIAEIHGAIDDR